jgi:hypothetical protein
MTDADIAKSPTKYIRSPWLKQRTFRIRKGKYKIEVFDQPGRWMTNEQLGRLKDTLSEIAERSMDDVPTYGVFTGERKAFANRLVGVVRVARTDEPVAFTAFVYMPVMLNGHVEVVVHLGLTMIKKRFRGQRIQGPLFEKVCYFPFFNQLKLEYILTNIAASPAGIGSVADYFDDAYPHYKGITRRKEYHVEVAQKLLSHYRHEFGCADTAEFDRETFVVRGSNDPEAGGAWQFIREDPVSRYKSEECNEFCSERLRFNQGDELFQVARVNVWGGTVGVIKRLGVRKRAAEKAEAGRVPAMGGK